MEPERMNTNEETVEASVPKRLRRLKSNELVSMGDFVANDQNEFQLWEGPHGFFADSFVRPIYRIDESQETANS